MVVPRTIESSTTTSRLPSMFSLMRVELDPDVGAALGLAGRDEGAADVAVADQAVAEGDAAAAGVALGRGDARLGHAA